MKRYHITYTPIPTTRDYAPTFPQRRIRLRRQISMVHISPIDIEPFFQSYLSLQPFTISITTDAIELFIAATSLPWLRAEYITEP